MGTQNDEVDKLGCSNQRLIFQLVLKELRALRKAAFSAHVSLCQGTDTDREQAMKILAAALDDGSGPRWVESKKQGNP